MPKAIKRQAKSNIVENPSTKCQKKYDINLISKDISMLENFYADLKNDDGKIIDEYLSTQDFNSFFSYFDSFRSYHAAKPVQFALVFDVCTEILKSIAGDLNGKHSLIGQNFADIFFEKYGSHIKEYIQSNKTVAAACIRFLTGIILQGSDVATKIIDKFHAYKDLFNKQLRARTAKDDDGHTGMIECFAVFFVLGSNEVITKLCAHKDFFGMILRDMRFDKCNNVLLVLELLHDKIVKNPSISKTVKVKLFNAVNMHFLLSVYEWKGAAISYDEFRRLSEVDPNCTEVHAQLHALLTDLCSPHCGIAFNDGLCGLSRPQSINKTLHRLITSDAFSDFFTHPQKSSLVSLILRNCPDLLPKFIDHLSSLMARIVPEGRGEVFKSVIDCYRLMDNGTLAAILSRGLSLEDGAKFGDLVKIFCAPTAALVEIIKGTDKISEKCSGFVNDLRETLMGNIERVLTWINVTAVMGSQEKREDVKGRLKTVLVEVAAACGWQEFLETVLAKEHVDEGIFAGEEEAVRPADFADEGNEIEDDLDQEIKDSVAAINDEDGAALKRCVKHFLAHPFKSVSLMRAIVGAFCPGDDKAHKKHKKKLFEAVTKPAVVADWWTPGSSDDDGRREVLRDLILEIVVRAVEGSRRAMLALYEDVPPLKLMSLYGGTLSSCDQKILFLLSVHQLHDIPPLSRDVLLFGPAVHEHFRLEAGKPPILWRPLVSSQCFNLLVEERLLATVMHFPTDRLSPVSVDGKFLPRQAQTGVYDPLFLAEWLIQAVTDGGEDGEDLVLAAGVDLKVLMQKRLVHFLVACQSSRSEHLRAVARSVLWGVLQRLEEEDGGEVYMRLQVRTILCHVFNTSKGASGAVRLPSLFSGLYVRLLLLLENPDKTMFGPLWELIIGRESLDLRYVPDFVYLMFPDKEDYRTRQLWCLRLMADTLIDQEDFAVLSNTRVLPALLSLYPSMDRGGSDGRGAVLALLAKVVAVPKAAAALRRMPGFLPWLCCGLAASGEGLALRGALVRVAEGLLAALQGSDGLQEVRAVVDLARQ